MFKLNISFGMNRSDLMREYVQGKAADFIHQAF